VLQNGLIQPAQLVAAFHAWTGDKSRSLADHLIALGHLSVAQRSVIEALADLHVASHSGDVARSLAALPAGKSTRESLAQLADSDLEGSLTQVGSASSQPDGEADPSRTLAHSFGTMTSDGQRFRVLRPHARGGLGAVFVALDAELNREVALKQILDQHADDPTSRSRFLVEAEITGGLEHPGIVPVYGLGTYADGRPFYAMRFNRGDSLKQAADRFRKDEALKHDAGRRSLELRRLLLRFTDVCNAIDYAHSRGVLHRDLKPGNIIVGQHGETLVVDWGLAKATGRVEPGVDSGERILVPASASGSAETLPGTALGTPAYMSPEQARGDLEQLGPRSDVYSLGATLSYLLTGRPPAEGDIGAVLRAVQAGESLRRRAMARRDRGDLAGASGDVRKSLELYESLPSPGEAWYGTACCHAALAGLARSAGSGVPIASSPTEADRAMEDLRRAVATGSAEFDVFRTEAALDPLRGRDDFQLLLLDLAFPTAAFARRP
jgi:tRNA A-37 threonylcarbamoyl transferase component Bud32